VKRLPWTPQMRALRAHIAAEFHLQDGDMRTSESITTPLTEAFARIALLEQRLAAAEGTVTRCGFCGAPLHGSLCRYCGEENRA
jgi:hypothetical protein